MTNEENSPNREKPKKGFTYLDITGPNFLEIGDYVGRFRKPINNPEDSEKADCYDLVVKPIGEEIYEPDACAYYQTKEQDKESLEMFRTRLSPLEENPLEEVYRVVSHKEEAINWRGEIIPQSDKRSLVVRVTSPYLIDEFKKKIDPEYDLTPEQKLLKKKLEHLDGHILSIGSLEDMAEYDNDLDAFRERSKHPFRYR